METNPLSLIIKEKTLGSLVTNAKDIKAYVMQKLQEYSVDNYAGDANQAAKGKAEINNAIKALNDSRIALEKEWNMPFQEFKNIITETIGMMKDATGKLDIIVKAKEAEEKLQKKAQIEEIWAAKNFNLVTLERVFNIKWLNKTTKLSIINAEIEAIIKTINGDLASLEAFGDDVDVLKGLYLSTLNLQETLNKGRELKANRERLTQSQEGVSENAEAQNIEIEKETEVSSVSAENQSVNESPIVNFCVCAEESELNRVRTIAGEIGIDIIQATVLRCGVLQIEEFIQLLKENGMMYNKTLITNLAVRRF